MTFSIKKAFKDSWNMFFSKKIYLPFVFTSLVAVLGVYLTFGIGGVLGSFLLMRGLWWVAIPLALVFLFIASYFLVASFSLPLSTHRTGEVKFKKIFSSVWDFKLIIKSLGLMVTILVLALVVGYFLSLLAAKIHPILAVLVFGVIVAVVIVRFAFSVYILIESKGSILSSLKKGHEMMKGNGWKFLLFIIILSAISMIVQIISNNLGTISPIFSQIIVILFGILVAPWFSLVAVSPYMQLKK